MLERLLQDRGILEREQFTREEAHALERLISRMAAIERYRIVRKYASGVVADAACGCGYGSWMLSRCPSVDRVIGLDADEESIAFARLEYPAASINFATCDLQGPGLTDVLTGSAVDTVVSVETVEHLAEPDRFVRGVLASRASRLILTFPAFVTSTFNPYHLSDVSLADLEDMVGRPAAKALTLDDAVQVVVFDLL